MSIVYTIKNETSEKFYLIGTDLSNDTLLDHEIAHGLYYTNKEYKKKVDNIIDRMTSDMYNKISNELLDMGYNKNVINDEIQAYLSTGEKNSYHKLINKNNIKKFNDFDKLKKLKDKCPNCHYKFNYINIPESGMGYIKCPKCDKIITQKDIKKYSTDDEVKLAKKICQDLRDTFEEYFKELEEQVKIDIDYSKYFKI